MFNLVDQVTELTKPKAKKIAFEDSGRRLLKVTVGDLQESPDQARSSHNLKDLKLLAESIENEGLHHPIHIWESKDDGKLYIASGHRRWAACKVYFGENYKLDAFLFRDESIAKEAAVSINELSVSIHPVDRGVEIESILKSGRMKTIDEIADYYGWSRSNAYKYKRLAIIPKEIRAKLIDQGINGISKLNKIANEVEEVNRLRQKGEIKEDEYLEVLEDYLSPVLYNKSLRVDSRSGNKDKTSIKSIMYLEDGIAKIRENVVRKLSSDEIAQCERQIELLLKRIEESKKGIR